MDNRIKELIEAFENNGWQLIGSVDIKSDWWFEDIISLQSKWSPVGKSLYLTLLTDPMESKKKVVWSISISTILPEAGNHHSIGQIALNDFKRTELGVFVKDINKSVLK
jgi:hypothetical protein